MKKGLVVLDMVNDIVSQTGKINSCYSLVNSKDVVEKQNKVIQKFRDLNLPIYFIRIAFQPDYSDCLNAPPMWPYIRKVGALKIGESGSEFISTLDIKSSDIIITKTRISPFTQSTPDFFKQLEQDNVNELVIAGVSIDNAVQQTARDAYDRNIPSVILADCCAASTENIQEITEQLLSKLFKIEFSNKMIDELNQLENKTYENIIGLK